MNVRRNITPNPVRASLARPEFITVFGRLVQVYGSGRRWYWRVVSDRHTGHVHSGYYSYAAARRDAEATLFPEL